MILTTPTPNKSTNTQKPTPAEDDDKNKKPDDKKNPLHTSETASNNKTQENVTQTIPKPVESLATQESVPTKNDKEEKPAEQEDKKDTLVPIKNDKDENTIAAPITDNEEIVSIKPMDQVEISTSKNDQTEKFTSNENEKSLESPKY